MKMLKSKKMFLVSILMVLLVTFVPFSTLIVLQTANATNVTGSNALPSYKVDFTPYFMDLGYTEKEMNELSDIDFVRILLSDGGKLEIDYSMEEICQNLFGNSTGPIPVPGLDKYNDVVQVSEESESALPATRIITKACYIVGIWNYQDISLYQYQLANSYSSIVNSVNNYGTYNYVKTLTNSAATHTDVCQWLIWLCASYDIVDIYFIGHGFYGNNGFYGYCCYDGVNSNGILNPQNLFYAPELKSYYIHNYSFSTLRLGVGGFCYSGAFKDYFLDEGAVWIGGRFHTNTGVPLEVDTDYFLGYIGSWGYYWYQQNMGSIPAYNLAHTAGLGGHLSNPWVFSHYTKGQVNLSVYK
jgi:hypothetical protein